MHLSSLLKILADSTRLRILNLLTKQDICVCLIEDVLGISQPNVSKHLYRLRQSGIICCRKISQWCFYSISESFKEENNELLTFFINQWSRTGIYTEDMRKLEYLLETNDCCKKLLEQAKQINAGFPKNR